MTVSWISKGLSIIAALLLIPVLFHYMPKEELGLWYIMGNSQAFVGLFGFGLAPVLTRHIALLAKSSRLDPIHSTLTPAKATELQDLLYTGRAALRWMALATMVVSWTAGYFAIRSIPTGSTSWTTIYIAWTLMCLGWSLQVWMSYLDCWLAGIGYVGWDTVITMSTTLLQTLAYIVVVVFFDGGLVTLACITVGTVFVQRILVVLFLRRKGVWRYRLPGVWSPPLAKSLVKPSFRFWGTAVGAFLIYKTDQYFIALFLGTATIALYQSTYNTVMSLALGAGAATSSITVFASQMWAENKLESVRTLLVRGCRIGFIVLICGQLFLLYAGKEFFQLWLKGAFIGYPVLIILLITLGLDTQHGLLTNISRATGDEVYLLAAMGAGLLNLLFTRILIRKLGLAGVPLGTLLAQLVTNNWYGVYRPLATLHMSFKRYLQQVGRPIAVFACLAATFSYACKRLAIHIWGHSRVAVCASTALSCAIAGAVAILIIFNSNGQQTWISLPLLRRLHSERWGLDG